MPGLSGIRITLTHFFATGTQAELHSPQHALSGLCPCSPSLLVRREETLGIILMRLQLLSYHLSILGNQQVISHEFFRVCMGVHCVGSSLQLCVEHVCRPAHVWSVCASLCWHVVGVCKDTLVCLGTCHAKGPRWVT